MTSADSLCPRESSSHARSLFRLLFLFLAGASAALSASAQYTTYAINTSVTSLPAGSYGATFLASVIDSSTTANFKVCFDTGYGSSKVPIVPYNYVATGRISRFNFDVPAATIQAVPPTAFASGSFAVSIYSVPTKFTACNGNEPGTAQGNTVTLNLPILRSVSLSSLPDQNPSLTTRKPSNLALTGTNFIGNSGTSGKAPSAVNFTATTTLAGAVKFVSSTALVSTIPTTIPVAAASVNIQVCNTATYSYCSNTLTLKTVALQQNPGTLLASPNPALTTQPVSLTANFGLAAHTVAGAPSGLVTFSDGGKAIGTANLLLERNASFVRAPTQQFLTYALPIAPIVADFNGDGLPDTLLIDPGTGNSGATLNLLLGTVPSGSFKANRQFDILSAGGSFIIGSATVADFNGDGVPDIVLLAKQNIPGAVSPLTLYTLLGNGDGTFQDGFISSKAVYGSQIVAGDFNKDGRQDIVIAGALNDAQAIGLQTLIGDGKGNFTAGPATTGLRTAPSPTFGDFKVVAADFNADGYPDIAVMNGFSPKGQLDNSIELYQNSGKGAFAAPVRVQTDGTATANFFVAPLAPGKPLDIIVTSTANQGIYVALNQSTTAKIAYFDTFEFTKVASLDQAVVGDFDGDGLLDVAVKDPKTIHVLSGDGKGLFTAKYASLSTAPPANATLIAASDQNGDSYADLLLYTAGAQDGNTRYPITLYDYITAGLATATLPSSTFTAGTHKLEASTKGTFNIVAGTATTTLTVSAPVPSTVTLTASPQTPAKYGTALAKLTAIVPVSSATGTMSFYNGATLLGTAPLVDQTNSTATLTTAVLPAGTYSFKAVYSGDSSHNAGTSPLVPYVISPVAATLSWKPNPATLVYGTALSAAQLNATASGINGAALAGAFTYVPALGTVLAVGSNPVVATFKPTDSNYTTATATQNIVVTQATPIVTWKPNPATIVYGIALSSAQLNATSSAPGTFVYTPALGTVLAAGTHALSTTFTPKDTKSYKAVTTTTIVIVTTANPNIIWKPNPATITYGTALSADQLDATSSTPGTFVYTPASGAVLAAGTHTLSTTFTPKDATDFKAVTTTASVIVTTAVPIITWKPNPATIPFGTALSAAQLDATSSTPGTFAYKPAAGTILAVGSQTLSATFTPADKVDFTPATSTATVNVTQTSSTTTLAITSGGATATSIPAGSVTTLTATVTMAGKPVTPGQVAFCDANYPHCTDIHLLGTAQLTVAGTATLHFVPGIGGHTYEAVFLGTDSTTGSTSSTLPLAVTGTYTTSTTIAQSGLPGDYTLTAETSGVSPWLATPPTGDVSFLDTTDGNAVLGKQALGTSTPGLNLVSSATLQAGTDPYTVVTADFNGDGKPDFAVASVDHLHIFLGNGDGTFITAPVGSALASTDPFLATGDFNGDGKPDLVVTNAGNTLTVLLGKGDGTFTKAASPSTGSNPSFIGSADINRDGLTDLVVINTDNTLTILLGNGDGTFEAAASPVFGALVATPTAVAVGDFNGDGKVDLAVTNCCATGSGFTSGISILLGNGDGTFQSPKILPQSDALTPSFLVAGDLDGDGHVDLATLSTDSHISVFLGDGSGGFSNGIASYASGSAGTGLVLGDFNGDAKPDLAISSTFEQSVSVLLGNGKGGFTPAGLPLTGQYPFTPASADFNGDGVSDLVTPNQIGSASVLISVPTQTATATLSKVSPNGGGIHQVDATYVGDTKYKASTSKTTALTGLALTPTITWKPNPATIVYGTALSAAQLNATSVTPGTFVYTPAAGAALTVGTHILSTTFTPKDTTDFKAVTITAPIVVTIATPTVTWTPNPATIPYGTALSAAQLNATSSTPGTFVYTPTAGTVLAAGPHTLSATFTPKDATDFKAVTTTTTVVITRVAPTITWVPNPASITSGTALSTAQLNATSNTPGTFVYTPPIGTVLAVGTQTLSVTFTPTDTTDFTNASKTVSISVLPAGLTVSPTTLVFGNQPYNTTSAAQTVTVTNPGTEAISISGTYSNDEPNPEDFLPTTTCPSSLLAGATCQISVTFLPDGVGPKSGGIDIYTNVPYQTIRVSGTGTGGILQVDPGNLKTIAGDGTQGNFGDGGLATAAKLNQPDGVAFDSLGDLYIADTFNSVVRKVDTNGKITTVAGTGTAGFSGDGGLATGAELNLPYSVNLDSAGNLYIQDTKNSVIRKVDTNGVITTFAGTPGVAGHSGDGGAATTATLDDNQGARFDTAGNLFVPQCLEASIRKIDTKGIITTVAGNFTRGYTGDGGQAILAQLACPSGVAFDAAGNFYIADYFNHAIRRVDTKGIITTIAGNGKPGATGDGGPAKAATLSLPNDVVFDAAGNLFIADSGNNSIRKIDTKGVITTVAGGLGSAGSANVNTPFAVTLDPNGNLYFSDTGNNAVREFFPQSLNAFPATAIGTTAGPQTVTLSNVGNVPIVIPSRTSFSLSGDAADFSLTSGTCLAGATLATAQSTCTLQISFTPTAAGARTLTVAIADNALNSPQHFTIGGNGTSILPTLKWTPPASIVYGTPLSATQLDAISTGVGGAAVAGTFAYTPAAGTVLTAGTHTLSVVFTPAGLNYLPFTATVPITVTQAIATVSWKPSPATIAYGTPLSVAQLNATSNIPGTFVYKPALGTVLSSGTQTLTAIFTPTDATDFKDLTTTTSILVTDINPVVNWKPNPAALAYGTPLSIAQLDAASTTPGTFIYTPALGSVLGAGPQVLSVLFTPDDVVNYKPLTSTATITVTQATPTIAWLPNPATISYGTALSAAQLDATSATPGTFLYTPAIGTVLAAGTHTLTAVFTPKDATDFKPITSTTTLVVTSVASTITWIPNPATIPYGTPLSTAQLDAISTVPGTFVYTPALGTILTAGPHTLSTTFTPKDSTDFKSITSTAAVTVTTAAPVISWTPNPATIAYGTPLSAAQLDATSSVPGTFAYTPALGAILAAGTQTLTAVFTPTDAVDYRSITTTISLLVTGVSPIITWKPNPISIPYGTPLSGAQLDATSSTPGTFVYTPALGTLLPAGTHALSVTFTPTDIANFKPLTSTAVIIVTQLAPAVAWIPYPSDIIYGTPLSAAQLDATARIPGTFVYTPVVGTVLAVGPHVLAVTFTPTDTANYTPITTTSNVLVGIAQPVLTWLPNPATITYGTALSAAQLDAASVTSGSFAYTPAIGAVLAAGPHLLSVTFTPTDTADFSSITKTVPITVDPAAPTVAWSPDPSTITFGTALSAAQLDATSPLPGAYTYGPSYGAILPAGVQTLTLRFHPTDTNYGVITVTRAITVSQARPTVTWTTPASINLGTALSATQLDAIATGVGGLTLPGTFTYTPTVGTILPTGTNTLSVLFTPTDAVDYTTATATVLQAVAVPATVTRLATTTNSSEYGQPVTFTAATLAGSQPAAGTTNFFDGTNPIGSSTSSPATLTLSTLPAGTHNIVATFVANDSFAGSSSTAVVQKVNPAATKITWLPAPATIAFNTPLSAAQLDATVATTYIKSVPGVFGYTPVLGTVLNAGAQTLKVTFTPTDTVDYLTSFATALITVTSIDPVVTWTPNPATISYGTALSTSQLDATSTVPGIYTYIPAGGAVLSAGVQTLTLHFQPTAPNYNAVTLTRTLTVTASSAVITWLPNPATIAYGTPLSASQLNATSSTPGAFTYTPALGTVLAAGTQTLSVLFTPTDTANFKPLTSTVKILVTQATPAISWLPNPATIPYGAALAAPQLDATSTTPGAFIYTPALGTLLGAGTHTLSALFIPTDVVDFKSVTTTTSILVTGVSPVLAWIPNPATIAYGTPLSAAQLDATSNTPGTFVYTPALGTVLSAGPQTLSVLFTPTDSVNFKPITTTSVIAVTPAIPVLTWKTPAAVTFGTPLSAQQLNATAAGINGTPLPGTFTYTPAAGTTLPAGTSTLGVLFTPTDTTDYKTAASTVTFVVTALNSTVSWLPNPATIVYGTALSAAQLDATSTTPGTFVYTPALGTVLSAGTQTLSVLFTPTDTVNFKPLTVATTIVVTQATPAVTWLPNPATIPYGTALSSSQLDATSTTSGTFVYTPAIGTVLGAGTKTLSVIFAPTDSVNFKSVTATTSIVVTGGNALVTWIPNPATIPYGTALSAAQLDATSTTPGTFVYTPPLGTVLGAGTQSLSVLFTPTDSIGFKPLTTTASIAVTKAKPSLLWTTPAAIAFGKPLSATQLDATATGVNGLPLPGTFTYTPAAGTVLPAGSATLSVLFTPTDAADYTTATATTLVTVTGGTPTITWVPAPASIIYGTALSSAQLDASSSTPGTFAYTPALGSVLTVGTQTLSVLFTPTDSVHFKTVTTSATIAVTQATPVVTWLPNPATIPYGTALSAAQLNATSTTPGAFAYTPALGTLLVAGTQTVTAIFTPTDTTDFKSVTTTVSLMVTTAAPTISWTPNLANISFGTALSSAQLDATSNIPGTFVYTPALGTILPAGTQTLSTIFTPKDLTNFKSASATTTIVVSAVTPAITWTPNPSTIAYGTALTAAQLNATSTTPGTFTYMPGLGTVLSAGIQTLSAVFTPSDTANFKPFTTTSTITITPAIPATAWAPNPATVAYGTPLSTAQLDATSTTPGTFVYTPALGTVLTAGAQNLAAVFTPADTVNYKSVTATASIVVTPVTPTITWTPAVATIAYGTALSAAQLDAVSTTPGSFSYTPALGTVLSAGTQTLTAVFTPKDTTDYKSVTSTIKIVVTASAPTITWTPTVATISYGTALSAAQLDATSTAPGTFVYTPALGAVLSVGTQTLSAVFTPTDTTNFKAITTAVTITVTAVTPTITWAPSPATITYGTPLSVAQLDATSTTPGTFVYTPAIGTILPVGTQTLSAAFTPVDTTNFKPITTVVTISVTASTPTITWAPSQATITYGTALSAAQLNATSSTPGTFVYTPALGTILTAGAQTLSVAFTPTDAKDFKSVTATTTITVTTATPAVTWLPNPATIPYGTALSAAQLDATSSTPGTFVYTPALGTILPAGAQTLSLAFTPTDTKDFKSLATTAIVTVQQTAPAIVWATPASIVVGTALSSAQLDATATGANGAALPGTFAYAPASGTLLSAGAQTLKVVFTPTDLANYTTATSSVTLQVIPVTLTSLSSTQAALGDPAKTITLAGTGFVSTAIVQVNGSAISTTFVNATTLTATIPAANFLVAQILQINVVEATQNQTTASIAFLVGAPLASAVFAGPSSIQPGTDTDLNFKLTNPYPVDLTANFTVKFTPAAGLPNDPGVLFTNGSTTYTVIVPANSTASPLVAVQGSTVAGSMSLTLTLTAGGVDVTPPSIQPLIIQAPLAVPGVSSASVTRSGNALTVVVRGLSNPRDMTTAKFHFTPVAGGSIGTEDVTIDVVPIFTTWYADPASFQYGSTFTYTQSFNLSSDASVVGHVSVTLTNSVGVSQEADTP